jgi:hypothetical protein
VIYKNNLIIFAFSKAVTPSVVQSINARKKSSVFVYRCNTRVIYGIPIFSQWIVRFCKKRSILNSCGSTCMKYQVLFKVVCKVLRAHFSTCYCCAPHYFLTTVATTGSNYLFKHCLQYPLLNPNLKPSQCHTDKIIRCVHFLFYKTFCIYIRKSNWNFMYCMVEVWRCLQKWRSKRTSCFPFLEALVSEYPTC